MPNGDTTTVNLKDGTVLHLKGKLSFEQVQEKVAAFRGQTKTEATKPPAPEMSTGRKALEVAKGFGKGALETGQTLERAIEIGTGLPLTSKEGREAYDKLLESKNTYQSIGKVGEFGAELALTAGGAGAKVAEKLPTISKGKAAFKTMENLAQHVNIDTQKAFDVADAALKSTKSDTLERFADRITRPGATRLTYKEARGFLLDAADEIKKALPSARSHLAEFMQEMNSEIERGVSSIGKLDEYRALSKQWKSAKEIEKAYNTLKDLALKKIIPYGVLPYFAARLGIKSIQGISQAP